MGGGGGDVEGGEEEGGREVEGEVKNLTCRRSRTRILFFSRIIIQRTYSIQ